MTEKRKKSAGHWAKLMGGMWSHPRVAGVSNGAVGLWARLLSWSADKRSDGVIPSREYVRNIHAKTKAGEIDELIKAGMLELGDGGTLVVRNWAKHNITRNEHEEDRERARNGMREIRRARAPVTRNAPATRLQPSDQDQDKEQDQSPPSGGDVARPPEAVRIPLGDADPIEQALRVGYAKRYEARTNDAWMQWAANGNHIRRAAEWCRMQPDPRDAAERFLDGAFAWKPWASHRWRWSFLVEDPALTASRSSSAVGDARGASERMSSVPTIDLESPVAF